MRTLLSLIVAGLLFTLSLGCTGGGGDLPIAPKSDPNAPPQVANPDAEIKGTGAAAQGAPDAMSSGQKLLD